MGSRVNNTPMLTIQYKGSDGIIKFGFFSLDNYDSQGAKVDDTQPDKVGEVAQIGIKKIVPEFKQFQADGTLATPVKPDGTVDHLVYQADGTLKLNLGNSEKGWAIIINDTNDLGALQLYGTPTISAVSDTEYIVKYEVVDPKGVTYPSGDRIFKITDANSSSDLFTDESTAASNSAKFSDSTSALNSASQAYSTTDASLTSTLAGMKYWSAFNSTSVSTSLSTSI